MLVYDHIPAIKAKDILVLQSNENFAYTYVHAAFNIRDPGLILGNKVKFVVD